MKSRSSDYNILLYYQNVRGLRTKLSNIYNSILSNSYPIIVLTETWLTDSFYNSEICDDRYVVYRADRSLNNTAKKRGGGVLVAVDQSLCSSQLECESTIEEIWVSVRLREFDLIICGVYIPPSSSPDTYLDHLNHVEQIISEHDDSLCCIVGDYNIPGISWGRSASNKFLQPDYGRNSFLGEVCDNLSYLNLYQFNSVLNHNNTVLDLVLSNSLDL